MKTLMILLLAAAGPLGWAQTNVVAPKAGSQPPTEINSDSGEFDLNARRAVYRGHVLVDNPELKLQCDWLVVDLPAEGGHLSHVSAETNVVIDFNNDKGEKFHLTSARAVYAYSVVGTVTNETVTFTGDAIHGKPRVENPDFTILSEPLVWDRVANKFSYFNEKIILRRSLDTGHGTNASPLKLF